VHRPLPSNAVRGTDGSPPLRRSVCSTDHTHDSRLTLLELEQAGLAQLAGQPGAIGSAHPRPLVPIR
jgi:hypothetical protein